MRDLTDYELELLGILQEECAEVIQVVSKIRRFGINNCSPVDPDRVLNRDKLKAEIGDVVGVVEMLRVSGVFDSEQLEVAAKKKVAKVKKYLKSTPEA